MTTTTLSVTDFEKRSTGVLLAVVALTGDMSEWVKVNKADLIRTLRAYGFRWVKLTVNDHDETLFEGAGGRV